MINTYDHSTEMPASECFLGLLQLPFILIDQFEVSVIEISSQGKAHLFPESVSPIISGENDERCFVDAFFTKRLDDGGHELFADASSQKSLIDAGVMNEGTATVMTAEYGPDNSLIWIFGDKTGRRISL